MWFIYRKKNNCTAYIFVETGNAERNSNVIKSPVNTVHCTFCKVVGGEGCQYPKKKKNIPYSSNPKSTQLQEGKLREGVGGPCKQRTGRERSRDSLLMSIWWVFCWSLDLFVLPLIPESSIPPSFRMWAQGRRCRCSVRLVMASWQRQLIGSSRIDPRSFPHISAVT